MFDHRDGLGRPGKPLWDLQDVIVIDSNMPTDEIKREVADKLENNEEKYCKVLKAKGFPEAQARRLLALMISCFKNSPQ